MKYLALIHSIPVSFLIIDDIMMLYTVLNGSKFENAPVSVGSHNYTGGPLTLIF
jgi:hypothetical protein